MEDYSNGGEDSSESEEHSDEIEDITDELYQPDSDDIIKTPEQLKYEQVMRPSSHTSGSPNLISYFCPKELPEEKEGQGELQGRLDQQQALYFKRYPDSPFQKWTNPKCRKNRPCSMPGVIPYDASQLKKGGMTSNF